MNKFYTLALLAACAWSASAATPAKKLLERGAETRFAPSAAAVQATSAQRHTLGAKTTQAPADITGEYYMTYYDEVNRLEYEGLTQIKAGKGAGEVLIVFPLDFSSFNLGETEVEVPATYAEGTLTITPGHTLEFTINEKLKEETLYTWHYNYSTKEFDKIESLNATWNGKGFTFDKDDLISLGELYEGEGSWFGIDKITLGPDPATDPDYDPDLGWTSVGDAEFVDGWILPAYKVDQYDYAYNVELQRNDETPTLYRLVDPYHGNFPMAKDNECKRAGYIEFDITDPNYVIFIPVEAGFANADAGITKLYCLNCLSMYIGAFAQMGLPYTVEQIVQIVAGEAAYTTFKDGVVALGSFEHPEKGTIYDACFGIQGDKFGGFAWLPDNEGDVTPNMEARITFPEEAAISDVVAGADNSPVEYFNLQGMRVDGPAAGRVLIRRQGTHAVKVRF